MDHLITVDDLEISDIQEIFQLADRFQHGTVCDQKTTFCRKFVF